MKLRIGKSVLDAEFHLESATAAGATFALILESKNGQGRNPDYYSALECLLELAGAANCQLIEARLVSRRVIGLPQSETVLPLRYPIRLGTVVDFARLRREVCRAQASIFTTAKSGRGNSHRRICLEMKATQSGLTIFAPSSVE